MGTQHNIAVIGAGVVGLSTAVCIQEKIPSAAVMIFADKFGPETLSDGAGGLFRPSLSIDTDEKKLRKWCESSLRHFYKYSTTNNSNSSGIRSVGGYQLSSSSPCYNKLLNDLLPIYREMTKDEMSSFQDSFKYGVYYETIITDCRYYLPWLLQKFQENGGKIEKRHLHSLSEISDSYDVLVNCTGLGAKMLVHDNHLVAIRGQTIKVKAPWIQNFFFGDGVYIIPGIDGVTLGGIKEYDSWNMNVNPYHKQLIWDKCVELVPSLKNAEFQWDWVGLRPFRTNICLESTIMQCNGKFMKVVNNYGHGGNGVTLSWGTAEEAAEKVEKLINTNFLIAKL